MAAIVSAGIEALPAALSRLSTWTISLLAGSDERAKTQRDALLSFAIRIASAGIAFLSQAVLARWMGTHDYGVFVFIWTWVLVLGGLSTLGLSGSTVRLLPVYRERGEHGLIRGLAFAGRFAAFLTGSGIAACGFAGLYFFDGVVETYTLIPAMLALACIPLYAFTDVQCAVARGRNWTLTSLIPPYILRPLLILAGFGLGVLAGLPANATTAAVAAVAATWSTGLIQAISVRRAMNRELPPSDVRTDLRMWLPASMPLVAIYACELIMQNADVLIISRYMTPSDVAIYFAAAKTMSLILFVQYAVGSAVATRFSALHARGDRKGLESFVADASNWTFWPSLIGAVALLVAGKPLLGLFGPAFADGYPIMFVLVAGFLMRSAMGPADILLNMLGEQKVCAGALTLTAFANIALNLLLVPSFGLMGAATATSLALGTGALLSYVAARRRLGLDVAIWNNITRARVPGAGN